MGRSTSLFALFLLAVLHVEAYLDPAHHEMEVNFDLYYKEPIGTPVGVLLLFHGCNHDPEDWFFLPAECLLVSAALRQNIVSVAIPSYDRLGSRCWNPDMDSERVEQVVEKFVSKRWRGLPLLGAGASSGGSFVAWLSNEGNVKLNAIAVYVSAGLPDFIEITTHYPPTIFIAMAEDTHKASERRINAYRKNQLEPRNIKSELRMCEVKKVTSTWLKAYYPKWSLLFASAIALQLKSFGMIDAEGLLAEDPRSTNAWVHALAEAAKKSSVTPTILDREVLRELLNIAWAQHEMTGEHAAEVVEFLVDSMYAQPA